MLGSDAKYLIQKDGQHMERASRFIVEQRCGKKDKQMFTDVMATLITSSEDVTV